MKRLTVERLLVALIALSFAAGAVWFGAIFVGAAPLASTPAAEPVDNASGSPVATQEARIDALLARPPFNPRRRPPERETAKQQELQPLMLVGVVMDAARPAVLLETVSGERSGLLRAGQSFGGWTIVSVQPNQTRLQAGERVIDVPLRSRSRP
jgi:hypothetical protein